MFFIIHLLTSLFLLSVTCAKICMNASVMLADGAGDAPLNCGFGTVLVLGIWFSNRFWKKCPLVVLVCCAGCPPVVAPISGGGVAVGWYPVGMWLFSGLGVLLCCFLQTLVSWCADLQFVQ